jgi:hypothetical protein
VNPIQGPIKCRIARSPDGVWVGIGAIPVAGGQFTVQEIVNEAPLYRQAERIVARRYGPQIREAYQNYASACARRDAAVAGGEIGMYEIGNIFSDAVDFAGNVVNEVVGTAKLAVKAVVNSAARKKLIEKLGSAVKDAGKVIKEVYEHPVFAGVVGVVSVATAPFGGAALGATYALSRAALAAAEKLANGDVNAIADMGKIAVVAAGQAGIPGSPEAANAIAKVAEAKAAIDGGPSSWAQYAASSQAGQAVSSYVPSLSSLGVTAPAGVSASVPPGFSSYAKDRARAFGFTY